MRIYDIRYFDEQETPRFPVNSLGWHKAFDGMSDIKIKINSHGFRGADPLALSSARIIMIGDSTVFNGGVELEETFPFLLQEKLRHKNHDSGIEVLNLGIGDISIRHSYLKLKEHALSLNPDLVIFFIYLNDATDSLSSTFRAANGPQTFTWHHSFAYRELSKLFKNVFLLYDSTSVSKLGWVDAFRSRRYFEDESAWIRMLEDAGNDWGAAWKAQSWEIIESWVAKILELKARQRFEVMFVLLPASLQIEIARPWQKLFLPQEYARQMAGQLHITLLDPVTFLKSAALTEVLYYDQCHFTLAGNRALAEYLEPTLQSWLESRTETSR